MPDARRRVCSNCQSTCRSDAPADGGRAAPGRGVDVLGCVRALLAVTADHLASHPNAGAGGTDLGPRDRPLSCADRERAVPDGVRERRRWCWRKGGNREVRRQGVFEHSSSAQDRAQNAKKCRAEDSDADAIKGRGAWTIGSGVSRPQKAACMEFAQTEPAQGTRPENAIGSEVSPGARRSKNLGFIDTCRYR
jgi:hypothetical protein